MNFVVLKVKTEGGIGSSSSRAKQRGIKCRLKVLTQ